MTVLFRISISTCFARLAGGLLLAGCASAAQTSAAQTSTEPAEVAAPSASTPVPAPLYATLFMKGKTWTLEGTLHRTAPPDLGLLADETSSFKTRCEVTEVARFTGGVRSSIECDDLPQAGVANLVEGTWVATADGLHHGVAPKGPHFELPEGSLILPASPKPERIEEKDPENDGFFSTRTITKEHDAWCFERFSVAGDEGWNSVCLNEKDGFVFGTYGWAGGSSAEVSFIAK